MTYVRCHGRPNLFITFTCNPKWPEIDTQLMPGQKSQDRHDLLARVFRRKVVVLMELIVKGCIFGKTRCYMYTIEWQKRGLPHTHILIWLADKTKSNQIDQVISHLKLRGQQITVDNRWVMPHSPLLTKTFNAHINVEVCNCVKSIKYICKYLHKGSDQAVFGLEKHGAQRDEVARYEMGRYISSNEAVWRILKFPIHERYPAVLTLSVHLENGQRVYFTAENVNARVQAPPVTTLTAFFDLCKHDDFARTVTCHATIHGTAARSSSGALRADQCKVILTSSRRMPWEECILSIPTTLNVSACVCFFTLFVAPPASTMSGHSRELCAQPSEMLPISRASWKTMPTGMQHSVRQQ